MNPYFDMATLLSGRSLTFIISSPPVKQKKSVAVLTRYALYVLFICRPGLKNDLNASGCLFGCHVKLNGISDL